MLGLQTRRLQTVSVDFFRERPKIEDLAMNPTIDNASPLDFGQSVNVCASTESAFSPCANAS